MLLDYFPKNVTPRPGQIQILKELDDVFERGYKNVIILAPTGMGKSYIAKTIADSTILSFIITSTKQLQDQYIKDFSNIKSIKGKSNFACYQQMDLSKISSEQEALRKGLTCNIGQCTRQEGKRQVNSCEYKSHIHPKQCIYYAQKEKGLAWNQTILNYAMYFQLKKLQPTTQGVLRNMCVFDEAHTIEGESVRFLGLDIWARYLNDVRIDSSRYKLDDIDEVLLLLDDLRMGYGRILSSMEASAIDPKSLKQAQNYSLLLNRYKKITDAKSVISEHKDNFLVQNPETYQTGDFKKLSIAPIEISKFAKRFFDSEYQVFLSATIDKENFSKSVGLENCAFINMEKSPFPKENREIKFLNVKRLNQSSSLNDRLEVIKQINNVMRIHQNDRGLILTSSKMRCEEIRRNLPDEQRRRIQLAHSENEDGSLLEILDAHKDTRNGVLLSSSLWQGIDLKDDLSRFQIIEKCPFLYLGDKRVRIKKEKDPRWYIYQTIIKLLQGIGRSIRNKDDYAKTYVMDAAVQDLLIRNRYLVPLAYHDVIY